MPTFQNRLRSCFECLQISCNKPAWAEIHTEDTIIRNPLLATTEKTQSENADFSELKFNHIHSFFEKSITFVSEKKQKVNENHKSIGE